MAVLGAACLTSSVLSPPAYAQAPADTLVGTSDPVMLEARPAPAVESRTVEMRYQCFLYREGGRRFYFDEGTVYAGRKELGRTERGCVEVPASQCGERRALSFHPESVSGYGYTIRSGGPVNTCKDNEVFISEQTYEEFARLKWATPYIDNIVLQDDAFQTYVSDVTEGCSNRACQIHRVYRDVVTTLSYIEDPQEADSDHILTPQETLAQGGGDCEDLTGVMNTYLEQAGVSSMVVLTEDHAYTLACGFDREKLHEYVLDTFYEEMERTQTEEVTLEPSEAFYYGGNLGSAGAPVTYTYQLEATRPIDAYVVPSQQAYQNYVKRSGFSHYGECQREDVERTTAACTVGEEAGIIIANPGDKTSTVTLEITYAFEQYVVDVGEIELHFYQVEGRDCVVLDATAGKYGYPGYSIDDSSIKMAVNPRTWEWYYLK